MNKKLVHRAVQTARAAADLLDKTLCEMECADLDTSDAREALACIEADVQALEQKEWFYEIEQR